MNMSEEYPPSQTAGLAYVAGANSPGLPHGDLQDCGLFGVWWFTIPARGRQPERREWAYAWRRGSEDLLEVVWATSAAVSGFATRAAAVEAATRPVTADTLTDVMIEILQDDAAEYGLAYPPCTTIALAHPQGRDRRAAYKRARDTRRYQDARVACAARWNARVARHGGAR